jgi:hypothetical protein
MPNIAVAAVSNGSYTYTARIFRQEPIVCMVELLHKLRTTAAEQEVSFLRHFLDGRILPVLGHEANGAAVVSSVIIFNVDDMLISKAL